MRALDPLSVLTSLMMRGLGVRTLFTDNGNRGMHYLEFFSFQVISKIGIQVIKT